MRILKLTLLFVGVALFLVVGLGAFRVRAYSGEAETIWQVEPPAIAAATDSAILERGAHVGGTLGGCTGCHGPDLSGGLVEDLGPVGQIYAPNLTSGEGGVGSAYSDAELARAIRHGIRHDGMIPRVFTETSMARAFLS
jgi:mono/diheme cytochrome c family protein